MKRAVAALVLLQAVAPAAAKAASACDVTAMPLGEPDKATAVYSRPARDSAVAGRVPPSIEAGEQRFGPKVRILGAQDGWLKIQVQGDVEELFEGGPGRPMYRGEGWVHAPAVYLNIVSDRAFQRPDPRSAQAFSLDQLSLAGYRQTGVVVDDCEGVWARVTMSFAPKFDTARGPLVRTGWLRGVCDDFVTSCDGITSD